MFRNLYFDKETVLVRLFTVCGIIYLVFMGIYAFMSYFAGLFMVAVLMVLEMEINLGVLVEFLANFTEIVACCITIVGFFRIKKSRCLFAIGWLCYAAQILVGCVILPLVSDIYGEPYPIYMMALHFLLIAACACIGLTMLIEKGNKWIIAGCAVGTEALYLLTLFLGSERILGTIGTHMWLQAINPFLAFCLIAAVSSLCMSTALAAFSYKSSCY